MSLRSLFALVVLSRVLVLPQSLAQAQSQSSPRPLDIHPRPIATDGAVRYDYDIVYVRPPRRGDETRTIWAEAVNPCHMEPGSDLMLLHPDGGEELLVAGGDGAVVDPFVSFDGQSVYFAKFHDMSKREGLPKGGADIYKIHVKTRKVTQLTRQQFTTNTGVSDRGQFPYGVFNLGPCPLPGDKIMFTSNRHGFVPHRGYTSLTLQLFVMDDDGSNVECIAPMNLGSALHPTILRDGRVMFSSFETQGLRDQRTWSIWTIHPDGTNWGPLVSDLYSTTLFHFQTQLSDGQIVAEEYYNLNNQGFGPLHRFAAEAPDGQPFFGPADRKDPRNAKLYGGLNNRFPFSPYDLVRLTPFIDANDVPAPLSDRSNPNSPRVGRFTHPSGAPDNHLLAVWSAGPAHAGANVRPNQPMVDRGLYLIKSGQPIDEPGQMLLIKNDPNYNEQWPRALVPYQRIYGVDEPQKLPALANDGTLSPHLPAGTPFGLVGTSSFYKRESYPAGVIAPGDVTAWYGGGKDPFRGLGALYHYDPGELNWHHQGAEAGVYSNSDIHAVRILTLEPRTDPRSTSFGKNQFWNGAHERMRILAEIPLRKFRPHPAGKGLTQPLDPDGNPDTSLLAKIPADVPFTFQTLDKRGMVLNMSQTWHQLRPGEIRNNCGGCHAHSQQPTRFENTFAARPEYEVFDVTERAPLLTTRVGDESGKLWDTGRETGLRFVEGPLDVEYYRDVKPILERSCAACHTHRAANPPGSLVLDDDTLMKAEGNATLAPAGEVPGTYLRLVNDPRSRFSPQSLYKTGGWIRPQVSRYVRMFQSRRSLLIWKVFGQRLDGWTNDDFPSETVAGDPSTLQWKGQPVQATPENVARANIAYTGSIMQPPEAVAGTYVGPDGKKIKVAPLSDEDKLTLARWIDLGCNIDFDFDPANPQRRHGHGVFLDELRPTLTVVSPQAGVNAPVTRLLIGMYDYYTGIDLNTFEVVANFAVDGAPAGANLASKFKALPGWRWELTLSQPITQLPLGELTVSVKDRQGNLVRVERQFSVGNATVQR